MRHRFTALAIVALAMSAATTWLSAQKTAPEPIARPAFSGAWILVDANAGGGKIADLVEVVPAGGSEIKGTGATDGAGTGVTGGRGGFVPGVSDPGNGHIPVNWSALGDNLPKTKPKRLSASEALRHELLTPPEELTISLSGDRVIIGDGIGSPFTYVINNKTEVHQMVNGSVKTKTSWAGNTLRQEIDAGRNADFGRMFELSDDGATMRVSVGPKASASDWSFSVRPSGSGDERAMDPRRSLYRRKTGDR